LIHLSPRTHFDWLSASPEGGKDLLVYLFLKLFIAAFIIRRFAPSGGAGAGKYHDKELSKTHFL
jgi:hypothetical protein